MSDFLKKGLKKVSKVTKRSVSQNVTPSASTSTQQSYAAIEKIDWALEIANILKDILEGIQLLAPLKASCALMIRGLEITRSAMQTEREWDGIVRSLEKQIDAIEKTVEMLEQEDRKPSSGLQIACKNYMEALQEVLLEASKASKHRKAETVSVWEKIQSHATEKDTMNALNTNLDKTFEDFMTETLFLLSKEMTELSSLVVDARKQVTETIKELVLEESIDEEYDSDPTLRILYGLDIPVCQLGTRVALLDDIRQWAKDVSTEQKIFWLKDAAGTGKTTVAATLARGWLIDKMLAGRFFFTPNSIAGSGIEQFCTTMAKDLAKHVPSLEDVITMALKDAPTLDFYQQFQRFIMDPLKTLKGTACLVLVIDALDNCDPDGRETLLHCVLEHLPNIPHLKLVLTSRPNPDIGGILQDSHLVRGREVQLLNIHDTAHTDIRIYIHDTLSKLTIDEREQVVQYSGGLFIVAATACRMLRWNAQPAKLLHKLINADKKDHLDELYLEVLRQAVSDPLAHDMMMNVLQVITVTFQPVSINTIRAFLPKDVEVDAFVQDLGAVLKDGNPDRPIKVLHPTFREFLAEIDRANGFLINSISSHALTAIGCLVALDKSLDYDVLKVKKPHQVVPRNTDVEDLNKKLKQTTAAARYASSYWTLHVAEALDDQDVQLKASDFLGTRFLNWLELMSWHSSLGDGVYGLSKLRTKTLQAVRRHQTPQSFEFDATKVSRAYQYLLQHQHIIQESALQAYSSALAFAPEDPSFFDIYRSTYATYVPRIISAVPTQWSAQDVLAGHTSTLREIEFSPDSSRLATRADDNALILWDTDSGAIVARVHKRHTKDNIASLAFSPDGHRLAYATTSSQIYMWNSLKGRQEQVIDAGPGEIVQISFSPLQPYIISASKTPRNSNLYSNNSIRLWSTLNGQKIGQEMWLDSPPCCLSISPDASRIVCVSAQNGGRGSTSTVTLWSLESFTLLHQYGMSTVNDNNYIAYSHNGHRFATWDEQGTVYLRNGTNGSGVCQISGAQRNPQGVRFSPVDSVMALFYTKEAPIIVIYDSITGTERFVLSGHTRPVHYISFSQDGRRLASISFDQTIRVWDTSNGNGMESFFAGYTGRIKFPTLSPDWTKLVTTSSSHNINLYSTETGTMKGDSVNEQYVDLTFAHPEVAFSPKGDIMVCGYTDLNYTTTLGLWSIETGLPVGTPMIGHSGGISSVLFSCDAAHIASLSFDGTMRIWDGCTGLPFGEPFSIREGTDAIFSPNGMLVACSSFDNIRIWDINTREEIWRLDRRNGSNMITFSPDGSSLAGGAEGRIYIWNVTIRESLPPKRTSSTVSFKNIVFGSSGTKLASTSSSHIQIWTISDEIQLLTEIPIVPIQGFLLSFSSNEKFLAYGSSVWELLSSPKYPKFLDKQNSPLYLDREAFHHSLLTYHDGWIYSALPPGPLLPIPAHLSRQFRHWHAYKSKMVVWTKQRLPVIVDCGPLLD